MIFFFYYTLETPCTHQFQAVRVGEQKNYPLLSQVHTLLELRPSSDAEVFMSRT